MNLYRVTMTGLPTGPVVVRASDVADAVRAARYVHPDRGAVRIALVTEDHTCAEAEDRGLSPAQATDLCGRCQAALEAWSNRTHQRAHQRAAVSK